MSRTSIHHDNIRFQLLRLLQNKPHCTQREIARELNMSLGGVNYCLRALVDKGMIKVDNFRNSKHKTGYLYMLTPQGISEKIALTERFLASKMAEYEALQAEILALQDEHQFHNPSL